MPRCFDNQRITSPPKSRLLDRGGQPAPPRPAHRQQESREKELAAADDGARPSATCRAYCQISRKITNTSGTATRLEKKRQQPVLDDRRQPQADQEPQHHRGHGRPSFRSPA